MTVHKSEDARRKALRRLVQADSIEVALATADLRWLLDEVARLQQSNDRLRRQNRKLRLRRDGEATPDVGADADPAAVSDPEAESPS